ncbi:unnamed protein product [Calicophoron daubneyi]|uniref:adenylate cyclase n=1 Tax=Calicophoron daubneyi TaxID=300641 RepID=A0AAV2TJB9_CALDB
MGVWFRGVQAVRRNSLQGHVLSDLFERRRRGLTVVREYFIGLWRILQLLQFTSTFVDSYFEEVWLQRTKSLLRMAIKFCLCTCLLRILTTGLLCPVDKQVTKPWWVADFLIFFFLYFTTFRHMNHRAYELLAILLLMFHIFTHLCSRCKVTRLDVPRMAPTFVTIVAGFALLPLPLEICICVIVVYIGLIENIDLVYQREQSECNNLTECHYAAPWTSFDVLRVISECRRTDPRTPEVVRARIFQWIFFCFTAAYLRFWDTIRRRFVFFRLGESVQSRKQFVKAREGKVCWIEAIVPTKVSKEYQRLCKKNENLDKTDWIYIKTFKAVTILFADIVGFTKMSSGLTAPQVVQMLGNLVKQFDSLCELKGCEKLGLIGDCYHCVSGCPEPNEFHARNCIEMGLGMCEILKLFNKRQGTHINIRVGVHTGKVYAAVIGLLRFHYDVYSYDVIIANELEQTGKPGFIHISQATYNEVKDYYHADPGPELQIDRTDKFSWARQVPASVRIFTYFINPDVTDVQDTIGELSVEESLLIEEVSSRSSKSSLAGDLSELNWSSFDSDSSLDRHSNESGDQIINPWGEREATAIDLADLKLSHQTVSENLKQDVSLIHDLREHLAKRGESFREPPLTSILLQFRSAEIEWHYHLHLREPVGPTFVDSVKLARICDALVLLVVIILFSTMGLEIEVDINTITVYISSMLVAVFIFVTLWFTGTYYPDRIKSRSLRKFYYFFTHPFMRELIVGVYTSLPTIISMAYLSTLGDSLRPLVLLEMYEVFITISMYVHCLPSSSAAWSRCLAAGGTLYYGYMKLWKLYPKKTGTFCLSKTTLVNGIALRNRMLVSVFELLTGFFLVCLLARDCERTCKLCFLVQREAEIEGENAEIAVREANELLYNIIPRYVFRELEASGRDVLQKNTSLRYAVAHPMIAVAFIYPSNFLSTLYTEDRKGGAASLRTLHKIICCFDGLLRNFAHVEKIKSVRESYLVASGLNYRQLMFEPNLTSHLIELMRYCFTVRDALRKFSFAELRNGEILVTKIGYNCGPVTAGIIGTAKPHYDIWGDTVNVASRMCYTTSPGTIQVTENTKEILSSKFLFRYRGEVFVKGKGIMRTYVCEGISPRTHFNS